VTPNEPLDPIPSDPVAHRDGQHRNRHLIATVLLGAVPFLLLAAWHFPYPPPADYGDWAQYLLHADALLAGRRYGDIGYIFTRFAPYISPPVQPPGLPVALVPLLALTNAARDSALYKVFMILCVLAFLAAAGAYLARYGSRPLVLAALALTGLWVETGYATTAVQPDVIFAALVWLMILIVDRPGEWTWGRVALITTLGLVALSFRVAGLPLLPAVALYALVHRRAVGKLAVAPVLVWCLCGAAAVAVSPSSITYAGLVPRDPAAIAHTVIENLRLYPFLALNLFLYPFPWHWWGNDVYHLLICGFAVLGAIRWLPRLRTSFFLVFAACYLGMLFVMPIRHQRYLMPLAPVALFCASVGIAMFVAWAARLTKHHLSDSRAASASLGIVAAVVAATVVSEVTSPRRPAMTDAPGAREVFARLSAARDSGMVRAVFVNPRVLTWQTGVPAMGFFSAPADTTIAEFRAKRITHVVLGDFHLDPGRYVSMFAAVAAHPHAFRRLYQAGVFTVYAFDSTQALP
jgi:hypothetical protein